MAEYTDRPIIDIDVMTRREDALTATFADDMLPELAALDKATTLLGGALEAVDPPSFTARQIGDNPPAYETDDPRSAKLAAMILMGSRGVRVIRAARAVLAVGYEWEARAHDRIVVELSAHRRVILDDGEAGNEAIRWMRRDSKYGLSGKVAALPGADGDFYANLSSESHGDPLPVIRMFDPEQNVTDLAPRRTAATRASIYMYAGFCRDQAYAVAELSSGNVEILHIDDLDSEIKAIERRLLDEANS